MPLDSQVVDFKKSYSNENTHKVGVTRLLNFVAQICINEMRQHACVCLHVCMCVSYNGMYSTFHDKCLKQMHIHYVFTEAET